MAKKGKMGETILLLEGIGGDTCLGEGGNMTSTTKQRSPSRSERSTKMAAVARRIRIPGKGIRCQTAKGKFIKCPGSSSKSSKKRKKTSFWGIGQTGQTGGQLGMIKEITPTLIQGGLAAGGAWVAQGLSRKVGEMLNVEPSSTASTLLTAGLGVTFGAVVGKISKRPDLGRALGIGAIVVAGLNLLTLLSPTAGLGVLTSEPAPYYRPAQIPPLAQVPALTPGGASVSNLYSDVGVGIAAVI